MKFLRFKQNLALFNIGIKIGLAYKQAFFIEIFTVPFTLFIYYFLWKAIYDYSGMEVIRGFTFTDIFSYFVLTTIVGLFTYTMVDGYLEYLVISGDLINELIVPSRFFDRELYFDLGMKFFTLVTQGLPVIVFVGLFLDVSFVGFNYTLLAIISAILALILVYLVGFITGMSAFWIGRIQGIRRFRRVITLFLSGGLIPLTFFPSWFTTISHYLPFEYMRYVPVNIYLGKYSLNAHGFGNIFVAFGIQILWIIILYAISQLLWRIAFKKFAGAGA